jgi:hypothetical protein
MGRPPNRTSAAFACPIGAERVSSVTRSSCPINPGAVMTWCSAADFWPWVRRILTKINHIERFNNTLRQRVSRLVRDALSFSKKLANHIGAIQLFICHYNLTRAAA